MLSKHDLVTLVRKSVYLVPFMNFEHCSRCINISSKWYEFLWYEVAYWLLFNSDYWNCGRKRILSIDFFYDFLFSRFFLGLNIRFPSINLQLQKMHWCKLVQWIVTCVDWIDSSDLHWLTSNRPRSYRHYLTSFIYVLSIYD